MDLYESSSKLTFLYLLFWCAFITSRDRYILHWILLAVEWFLRHQDQTALYIISNQLKFVFGLYSRNEIPILTNIAIRHCYEWDKSTTIFIFIDDCQCHLKSYLVFYSSLATNESNPVWVVLSNLRFLSTYHGENVNIHINSSKREQGSTWKCF